MVQCRPESSVKLSGNPTTSSRVFSQNRVKHKHRSGIKADCIYNKRNQTSFNLVNLPQI